MWATLKTAKAKNAYGAVFAIAAKKLSKDDLSCHKREEERPVVVVYVKKFVEQKSFYLQVNLALMQS
jgi:hypothetical protein